MAHIHDEVAVLAGITHFQPWGTRRTNPFSRRSGVVEMGGYVGSTTMRSPQPMLYIVSELDPDVVSDSEWRSIWQIVLDVTAPAWSPVHDVMVQASR